MSDRVYVGLGSNVGDRLDRLVQAVAEMRAFPGIRVVAASPVYETEAHVLRGQPPQPDHLNAVVEIVSNLPPRIALERLHRIERDLGRDAGAPRWSPRPIDLDLLVWGDLALDTPELTLPHPRLAERRFVLTPLADVAPRLVVPGTGRTVADLLVSCPDTSRVVRTAGRLLRR